MAQIYYPMAGTQVSKPQEWSAMAKNWLATGVINGQLNELSVYADSTGMIVKVKSGQAFLQGHFFQSDSEETFPIATANSTNPRIDRVIVRLDYVTDSVELAILQGVPSVSPTPPALTQNSTRWEIALAQISVGANVSTITVDNVTNEGNNVKNANTVQEAWKVLTLVNGWQNFGSGYSPALYHKDQFSFVVLRGLIFGGTTTSGFVICTLPVEYRPPADEIFTVSCQNVSGDRLVATLYIKASTGDVGIDYVPGNSSLTLSGIRFRTS